MNSLKKSNFIVSTFEDIWVKDSKYLTLIDPYIYENLLNRGFLKNYDAVEVLKLPKIDRKDISSELNFIDRKHTFLRKELISRLQNIHVNGLESKAWEKLISLSLLRHVKFCHDMFTICEKHFDLNKHFSNILDAKSFHVPDDFNSHRQYYQHTELGSEQLFSIYCQLFYPNRLNFYKLENKQNFKKTNLPEFKNKKSHIKKIQLKIKLLFQLGCYRKFFLDTLRRWNPITVIVFDCSFSKKEISCLEIQSFGKIAVIDLPVLSGSKTVDMSVRSLFEEYPNHFDRFDRYVFATLKYALPLSLIENFDEMKLQAHAFYNHYPSVKWALSEWWIGHSTTSFFLAIASQRKIRHLYPEHNYIAYPFLGNNLRHIYPLVDLFISTGWENQNQSNHVSGGSMYPWLETENKVCMFNVSKDDLLFVSSIPVIRTPELNCSYGESGSKMVLPYLEMNRIFFNGLRGDVLQSIAYLPYPKSFSSNALVWDQSIYLKEFIKEFKYFIDDETPAKVLMKKARLTIINYLSTSYLEALMMNVPIIVLWRKDSQLLNLEHQSFFDELIEVGIFQDDPIDAAIFINKVFDDPYSWWGSPKVQNVRQRFLNKNLKGPEVFRKTILELVDK